MTTLDPATARRAVRPAAAMWRRRSARRQIAWMLQVPPSEIVTVDRSDGRTLDERFYITPCLLQVAVTGGHEYALTISRDPVSGMLRPTV